MSGESFIEKQEENISAHIFSVSAGMVGVCLTVISLINVGSGIRNVSTLGDDLTAADALVFILSCYLSYRAMKTQDRRKRLSLEKATDRLFLFGLALMVAVCFFVVYAFTFSIRREQMKTLSLKSFGCQRDERDARGLRQERWHEHLHSAVRG